jgi:hypothetical protein
VVDGKKTIVLLQADQPDWSEDSDPAWITVEDDTLRVATVGGLGVPILARAVAEGNRCLLGPLPKGLHLIVKYHTVDDGNNLFFLAFNADVPLNIDIDLEHYPTEIEMADDVTDVSVRIGSDPVTVSSIDAVAGKIVLESAPESTPVCNYWANVGPVWS